MKAGDVLQQTYQLEEQVGSGGQGECWLVREGDQQWLAKVTRLHQQDWAPYDVLEREASLLQQIAHPGIPTFRDLFLLPDQGAVCLVREWIQGQPLQQAVEDHRYTEQEAQDLARQLLDILHYLHSLSPAVIHRDIKPSNVIIRPDGAVSLIDFGTMREAISHLEGASIVGTYGYTPPEQFLGHPTPASDLYALGATLVYVLARRHPSTLPLDHNRLQFEEYINVQGRFLRILQRLLAPTVEERFQSTTQVLEALSPQGTLQEPQTKGVTELVNRAEASAPRPQTETGWQRQRQGTPQWRWERGASQDNQLASSTEEGVELASAPAFSMSEGPDLSKLIRTLQNKHKLSGIDEWSDVFDVVEAIDQHFGRGVHTGRQCIIHLLHPYDAADLLFAMYEPHFLLSTHAKDLIERFSLLFSLSSDNDIGQWVLLYFLQKHGWLPQSDWYGDQALRLEFPGKEIIGLPRRMLRFLERFEQMPLGKRAAQYGQLRAHWDRVSHHFHLCSAVRPIHLELMVKRGFRTWEREGLPTYSALFQEQWQADRILRWTIRTMIAWPPYWLKLGPLFQRDANKFDRLGTYIATVYQLYGSLDQFRTQLQEEYSWLLPQAQSS